MAKEIISAMRRYELKFILSKEQVSYFKAEILKHMNIDKYGLTTISSLYYDTPDYLLINRSIEKPTYKEKIRLRSYGLANNNTPIFLEIKRKNDKIVYKRRIVTNEKEAKEFFEQDKEIGNTQISKELKAFKDYYGVLEPKILIIYDRIAYFQENSDLRITIDMNPRYRVNDLNLHSSFEGVSLLNEGEAILEIKVQESIPLWLTSLLTNGRIFQSSFSKVGEAYKREIKNKVSRENTYKQLQAEVKGDYQYGFTL